MSEQGHAKNIEQLKLGRDFAVSWGIKYNPTNPLLTVTNLNKIISESESALDDVQTAKTPYRNATAAAQDAFAPLSELITRVMNALKASGVPESVIEDAKTYSREVKGQRKGKKPQDDPNSPEFDESAKAASVSHLSRTQRIESFDSLVSLLGLQTLFAPNEDGIKLSDLINYSDELKAKTEAVQTTFVELSNKRAARDAILYADGTGLVDVGNLFKRYVESFGRSSTEWNQIKTLEFTKIGRK